MYNSRRIFSFYILLAKIISLHTFFVTITNRKCVRTSFTQKLYFSDMIDNTVLLYSAIYNYTVKDHMRVYLIFGELAGICIYKCNFFFKQILKDIIIYKYTKYTICIYIHTYL